MPRHSFSYSRDFLDAVRKTLNSAIEGLEERRSPQEPKLTSALLGRLQGLEVRSKQGEYLRIDTTDVADRGRDSAERRTGADFVITATCADNEKKIRKAIMFQMKEGGLKGLPPAKRKELSEQVEKMKKIVDAPKIGGIVRKNGRPEIQIASGSRFLEGEDFQVQDFASYFNQRVITTLDGNTDACTVDMLQDGDLPTLTATVIKGGLTRRRS
jgi:hypothetical protein